MKLVFLAAIIIFLSSCLFFEQGLKDSDIPGFFYEVRAGDSLSKIALKFGVFEKDLMEINGLENINALKKGQILYLPDPDPISLVIARSKNKLKVATNEISKPEKKITKSKEVSKRPVASSTVKKESEQEKFIKFPVPEGEIFRRFSRSKTDPYDGIGIKAKRGARVVAGASGTVLFVGDDGTKFGLLIIIEHKDSLITVYTHLETATVKTGQFVKEGITIGSVGSSGGVKSPRLHFQVRKHQRPEDPLKFLKSYK